MNLTLNSLAPQPTATATDPVAVTAAVPAPEAQVGAAPAAFAQWLGLGRQADATALLAGATAPATDSSETQAEADEVEAADQPCAAEQPRDALMAAMSMPLMAPPQAPSLIRPAGTAPADEQAGQGSAALPLTAAELRTGLAGAALPATKGADTVADEASSALGASAGSVGSRTRAQQSIAADATAVRPAQPAAPTLDATAAAGAIQAGDNSAAPAADRPAGGWGVASAAPASASASARAGADSSVTLAGPPAAWRQTLHEALGERLNLQLTNRAEQAVIRLEPPMLGRVDIAIRHSAGTLEVTISATHGEVLRQLNAVSDNLRSDLAARQFSDVAVTVTQAPRSAQANPQGDPQGRARQPGREEQPKDPGRALADAGDPASTFSLNGRA